MRGLGIVALILVVLSFFFWLASWLFWRVFLGMFGVDNPIRYVADASSVLGVICELLAIGLLGIGLMKAAKRLPKA